MLKIKTPKEFYCEVDAIKKAGEIASGFGRRAYIIAGEKAFKAVKKELLRSLDDYRIEYSVNTLTGYPTYGAVEENAGKAYRENAELVIAIGGGKVCDVGKAVANFRNIPVVMIPTVAATCACWAARSVLYTSEGDFDRILWNENNPDVIVADLNVLKEAPRRYLAAGILDTLAKWYEFRPLIDSAPDDVVLRQDVAISKLAFDILTELGEKAYVGEASDREFCQVLESIFFLAGASGSFANGKAFRGFAHSYYYASTHIAKSRHRLHGEKVGFGLLIQSVLKKDDEVRDEIIRTLRAYDMTDTPYDWGTEDTKETIKIIGNCIITESPVVVEKGFVSSADECAEAIETAAKLLGA